jgi:hypothetical protein
LEVEAITQNGAVLNFGRDEEKTKVPMLGMGLLSLDRREH